MLSSLFKAGFYSHIYKFWLQVDRSTDSECSRVFVFYVASAISHRSWGRLRLLGRSGVW
jgi:hypothetical protein